MTTYTDQQGNLHILLRDGTHYVMRGNHYTKVNS